MILISLAGQLHRDQYYSHQHHLNMECLETPSEALYAKVYIQEYIIDNTQFIDCCSIHLYLNHLNGEIN